MRLSPLELCRGIRHVRGGYVVVIRPPFGDATAFAEVVCATLDDVFELLVKADIDADRKPAVATVATNYPPTELMRFGGQP